MNDEEMAEFLGFGGDPRGVEAVQKLEPAKRALFERMSTLEHEANLWSAGLGPKPEGVLIDGPEDPWMRRYIDK